MERRHARNAEEHPFYPRCCNFLEKNYFEREARIHTRVAKFAEGDPDTCLQNNNTVTPLIQMQSLTMHANK